MRLFFIFLAEFIFSLHFAATLYINSSFLAHFFDLKTIGLLYVLGALGNVIFFLLAPWLLNKFRLKGFLFFFLFLTLFSTVGAAFASSSIDATFFFLLYASVSMMNFYALDLLLEEHTTNKKTGEIRGLYLTVMNTAIALGPVLITIVGVDNKFKAFYIAAAILLIPLFLLNIHLLRTKFPHRGFDAHSLPFLNWLKNKAVRRVTATRLALEFFYAFMAIYMPIYLHSTIGFTWIEIGIIFAIMLTPFVLFEWPAGELADRKFGEKGIMSLGFLITLISIIFMPSLGHAMLPWIIVLFFSRVGASFIEITTESYFFKKVSSKDSGLISIFRLARSAGLILGAGIGGFALARFPFYSIFIILAGVMILGLRESRRLVDIK